MDRLPVPLPGRAILTDDPLRAKMLAAHHLENSDLIHEHGDALVYTGRYNGSPIAIFSSGFGNSKVLSCLGWAKELGAKEIAYIGACMSTTLRHGLGSVILANGGSPGLLRQAGAAAGRLGIPVTARTVLPPGAAQPEGGCIVDGFTGAFYEYAKGSGVEALSILTVSEDAAKGEKMEEHEVRSRFYAAARLVFETLTTAT